MAEVQTDTLGSREDTLRFLDMVGLFSSQAMMALGKVMNPTTNKAEKNLPVARLFIDVLEMLERKTQGNLTPDETKILKSTLTDLRLMFVEESKAPAERESPKTENAQPTTEDKSQDSEANPQPSAADAKVKFHKKYE